MRLCYVEDDAGVARSVMRALARLRPGWDVRHCTTVQQAIEEMATCPGWYHVLCDVDLKAGGWGLDLLAWAREYEPTLAARFVFLSSQGAGYGVPYLEKPCSAAQVVAALEALP